QSTLLTIGVGHDIKAEEKLLQLQPNVKLYGADPITAINDDLYSKIGKFFPFAIGNETMKTTASVLTNETEFSEGAEYDIMEMFYRNNAFDGENIVFCQVNMETHSPNKNQKLQFIAFIKTIIREKKYVILRSLTASHNRLYFVNIEDKYCLQKY
ncbi:hypothetical protein PFISCL1PPCAC_18479, partial [Pristionchus fissidentatus]